MADRVITLTTDGMGTNGVQPYDGQRHAYRSDQADVRDVDFRSS